MTRTRTKRTLDNAFAASDVSASRGSARRRRSQSTAADAGQTQASQRVSDRLASQENKEEARTADEEDSDHEYEVEAILEESDGLFFVKWLGYDSDENTWEPEENLKPETVKSFRRRHGHHEISSGDQVNSPASEVDHGEDREGLRHEASDSTNLIGAYVCFTPDHEAWMPRADYRAVGSAYLTGIVTRIHKSKGKTKSASRDEVLYEVRWTTTQFQMERHIHKILRAKVLDGITSFNRVNENELRDETWDVLCRSYHEETVDGDLWDDFEQVGEVDARYDCQESVPEDVEEVEKVASMEFQPLGVIAGPNDLYTQEDGSTAPQVKSEFKSIFVHSASSRFLAYLPLAFWRKVVENTNAYAAAQKRPRVSLDEMMKFLGILFYMALIDKGEYANYWGDQVEDTIFDSDSVRLDPVIALKRFEYIRLNLCFRHEVSIADLKRDPAARIRPLMNMLKLREPSLLLLGGTLLCTSQVSLASTVCSTPRCLQRH